MSIRDGRNNTPRPGIKEFIIALAIGLGILAVFASSGLVIEVIIRFLGRII